MRLMTWNMQGGNDGKFAQVAGFMKKHKIQIACLQETGTLPDRYLNDTRSFGNIDLHLGAFSSGPRGETYSVINFDNRQGGNNRCSLAIFCEPAVLDTNVVTAPRDGLRPLIGLKIPGDTWIYSIHAPSSAGAKGVATSMLTTIPAGQASWACLGDYNCSPDSMRPTGFSIVAGGAPTHQSGNTLDYAVSRNVGLTHAANMESLVSDHYAQVFDLT